MEAEDIQCQLMHENFTTLLPMYNHMLGAGIQVMVRDEDFEEANKIYIEHFAPAKEEMKCPNCGSTDISISMGKGFWRKLIAVIISLLAFIPFGNIQPRYRCNNCDTDLG